MSTKAFSLGVFSFKDMAHVKARGLGNLPAVPASLGRPLSCLFELVASSWTSFVVLVRKRGQQELHCAIHESKGACALPLIDNIWDVPC